MGLHESAGSLDELYETVGVIGRGSFAEINLLKKREGGELFALKTCCKLDALSYAHLRQEAVLMKPLDGTPSNSVDAVVCVQAAPDLGVPSTQLDEEVMSPELILLHVLPSGHSMHIFVP